MKTEDDIRDVAIRITDKLVEMGIIPNCTDTDDETEFEVQDVIVEELTKNQQTMKAEYDIQKMSVSELTNLKVELEKRADYNAPILDEIEEILTTKNNN